MQRANQAALRPVHYRQMTILTGLRFIWKIAGGRTYEMPLETSALQNEGPKAGCSALSPSERKLAEVDNVGVSAGWLPPAKAPTP